jgi:hypothetical protein
MGMAPSWWVKGDTNGFASESARLLCRRHNEWSERSRAACARCRFVGRSYRGAYSGSVATSMSEAELDECGSYLPLVDRTARQHASDNSRRNRQRLKWRRRSGSGPDGPMLQVFTQEPTHDQLCFLLCRLWNDGKGPQPGAGAFPTD